VDMQIMVFSGHVFSEAGIIIMALVEEPYAGRMNRKPDLQLEEGIIPTAVHQPEMMDSNLKTVLAVMNKISWAMLEW